MKISRRDAVKFTAAGMSAVFGESRAQAKDTSAAATSRRDTALWDRCELAFPGPASGNPFREVELQAEFRQGERTVRVRGFYDGQGQYKLRFMPEAVGTWTYTTTSNVAALHQRTGQLRAIEAKPGTHGPVRVKNVHHFAHADGTAYLPFGTTCYAWVHQTEALQQQTLRTLASAPFNKLRMCLFPKHYEYNHNEPALYPFERDASGVSDFSRPNPAFFAHLERRILDLQALGIEADLILFHPYDRWGYATMSAAEDEAYLRYALARLSAFRNVWWSLANEFDLMKGKTTADFDRLLQLTAAEDPYAHLRSIHYSHVMYDYSRPWVTHASLQTIDFDAAPRFLQWNKPVIYDEMQYEGNLNKRWGNISGSEMVRRSWLAAIHGCYSTHGETYLEGEASFNEDSTPTLWWSHGGNLHGTSPQRIAFLRKVLEEAMRVPGVRLGLEPQNDPYYLNASVLDDAGRASTILFYFDFHQPVWYEFPLPEGRFAAALIDPEAETIKALPGVHQGKAKLQLSGRAYQAVRFRAVREA